MAAPENIKAGFLKEKDIFSEQGIKYVAPLVCLAEPALVPKQIHQTLKEAIPDLTLAETRQAVRVGYAARSIRSFAGTGARFSSGARAMTGLAS
jgi:predicted nucleotide-binding protein (sugar kinase/HSP70/actin superfamily)